MKIQEKLKVRETKKKVAKTVTKGVNQGKKTGKKAVKETKKTIKALKKGKIQKRESSTASSLKKLQRKHAHTGHKKC